MALIGVGVSMDAFAASICKGLCSRKIDWKQAFLVAFFFGLFQAIMPLVGWLLGSSFSDYIQPIDHWIAFGLLVFVGAKMIWDAIHENDEEECPDKLDIKELLMLSIATSIDALVVGISFALSNIDIWVAITIIGLTTFSLSFIGYIVGARFGARFRKPATITGGVALILLGVKILLEHKGVL